MGKRRLNDFGFRQTGRAQFDFGYSCCITCGPQSLRSLKGIRPINTTPDRIKWYKYIHSSWNSMTDQMQAVRDTVTEILRENGVKREAFFGSIVRGEMD